MKTLWLGCSHSAGIYDSDNNLIDSNGIPVRVLDNLNVTERKIITTPGNGLLAFSRIIDYLEKRKKLNDISNIILQLTDEPRMLSFSNEVDKIIFQELKRYMTFSREYFEEEIFHYHSVYRKTNFKNRHSHIEKYEPLFSHHSLSLYEMYKEKFRTSNQKKMLLDITENIQEGATTQLKHVSHMSSNNIIRITKKHNINLYTFLYRKNTFDYENNELKKYDIFSNNLNTTIVQSTPDELKSKYYHKSFGHPLINGVKYATDLVTENLIKSSFKG